MTVSGAILHSNPDWFALGLLPDRSCARAIEDILRGLEGAERHIYAIRGEALRLFDERRLYREYDDPATRKPCTCTFRFLQIYMPDSYRYCEEALRNRQALHSTVPLEVASRIPRANLRLLEKASESVRARPEVQEAGETLTQEQFAARLSRDYGQHLEADVVLKFKMAKGDAEIVRQALAIVGEKTGITDPASELLALAIDFVAESVTG